MIALRGERLRGEGAAASHPSPPNGGAPLEGEPLLGGRWWEIVRASNARPYGDRKASLV